MTERFRVRPFELKIFFNAQETHTPIPFYTEIFYNFKIKPLIDALLFLDHEPVLS